jgi:hypothetical protein
MIYDTIHGPSYKLQQVKCVLVGLCVMSGDINIFEVGSMPQIILLLVGEKLKEWGQSGDPNIVYVDLCLLVLVCFYGFNFRSNQCKEF